MHAESTPSARQGLEPLLVLRCGRSGSTLLMQLLSTAAEIGFRREAPFEERHLSYLLRWAQLFGMDAVTTPDWRREAEFREAAALGNVTRAPGFPWPQGGTAGRIPLWQDAFEAAWCGFSERAVQVPEYAPAGTARFHAEKTEDWVADSLEYLGMPLRRLWLLRDPRDVLLSIWSFNAKRGTLAFGVREGESIAEHAERMALESRPQLRRLIELPDTDPGQRVVRYEAMMADLGATATRLGDWLGVELDAARVLADRSRFAGHRTRQAGAAPRWRSELDPALRDRFAAILGAELEALGYPC